MHQLDGPRTKVKRAKSQLITLQNAFQRFFKQHPSSVVIAEFDRNAGYYNLRIKDAPPTLPDEYGVLIGEIVHNLRSALDLLAWQLALLNNPKPYDRTAFPIYLIGRTEKRQRGRNSPIPHFWHRNHGLRLLQSIHRCYLTRIEAFQPCKRGNGGRHSPLFLLHELNNIDKHRLITVLATIVGGIEFHGLAGGGSKFKVGMPIHPNAKVGYVRPLSNGVPVLDFSNGQPKIRMQTEVQVNLNITPGVCFGDGCDAANRLPVIRTLQRIANNVSSVIESFAGEF